MRDTRVRSSFVPKLTRPVASQARRFLWPLFGAACSALCLVLQSETSEERDAWIKAVRATIANMVRWMDVLLLVRCLHRLSFSRNVTFILLFLFSDGPLHPLLCTPLVAQVAQAGGPELAGAAARKASSPVSAVGAPVGAGTGSAEVRRCSVAATTPRKNTQNHAVLVVMDGRC